MEQELSGKISARARLIFEQSGSTPGNDEANWLRAESEILRSGFEVLQSATWITLVASILDTSGRDLQTVVRPKRVIVRANGSDDEQNSAEAVEPRQREIFLAANLPVEVDPVSAAASFREHTLRVMVRKRRPENLTAGSESASN